MKCKHYALHFIYVSTTIELTAYWTQSVAEDVAYMMSACQDAALLH